MIEVVQGSPKWRVLWAVAMRAVVHRPVTNINFRMTWRATLGNEDVTHLVYALYRDGLIDITGSIRWELTEKGRMYL